GLFGRSALLVAENFRPAVSRRLGASGSLDRFPGLQSHLLPPVHPRLPRHAAPLLPIPAGVPGAERTLDRWRHGTRRWLSASHALLPVVDALRQARARQSVERRRPGMDDIVAAHDFQL